MSKNERYKELLFMAIKDLTDGADVIIGDSSEFGSIDIKISLIPHNLSTISIEKHTYVDALSKKTNKMEVM